jgi:hypothetical protein
MESAGQEHKTKQMLPPQCHQENPQYQLAMNENKKGQNKQVRFCFCNNPRIELFLRKKNSYLCWKKSPDPMTTTIPNYCGEGAGAHP